MAEQGTFNPKVAGSIPARPINELRAPLFARCEAWRQCDDGAELGELFDVLATWRHWADEVRVHPLDCGHFLAEEAPEETLAELLAFFDAR